MTEQDLKRAEVLKQKNEKRQARLNQPLPKTPVAANAAKPQEQGAVSQPKKPANRPEVPEQDLASAGQLNSAAKKALIESQERLKGLYKQEKEKAANIVKEMKKNFDELNQHFEYAKTLAPTVSKELIKNLNQLNALNQKQKAVIEKISQYNYDNKNQVASFINDLEKLEQDLKPQQGPALQQPPAQPQQAGADIPEAPPLDDKAEKGGEGIPEAPPLDNNAEKPPAGNEVEPLSIGGQMLKVKLNKTPKPAAGGGQKPIDITAQAAAAAKKLKPGDAMKTQAQNYTEQLNTLSKKLDVYKGGDKQQKINELKGFLEKLKPGTPVSADTIKNAKNFITDTETILEGGKAGLLAQIREPPDQSSKVAERNIQELNKLAKNAGLSAVDKEKINKKIKELESEKTPENRKLKNAEAQSLVQEMNRKLFEIEKEAKENPLRAILRKGLKGRGNVSEKPNVSDKWDT
jgi:hypothetical protein